MKLHPKGILVLATIGALFTIGLDLRWGLAAIAAIAIIDVRSERSKGL